MSKAKDIYIFITFPKANAQNNEIKFVKKNLLIQIIKTESNDKNKNNNIVLKYNLKKTTSKEEKPKDTNKKSSKKEKINIEFTYNNASYAIDFDLGDKTFIYQPTLVKQDKFYKIKKEIPQDEISNTEKMNIFYKALIEESGKDEEFNNLYKDTINLYGKHPSFELLINIFVKVYNISELNSLILKEFKTHLKKGSHKNENVNEINLQKFKDDFIKICDKAKKDKIMNDPSDNITDYFGLILCYYYNTDFKEFLELVNYIYSNNCEILFEILLTYKSYFKKELKIDEKILDEFIQYSAGKTYNDLTENGLFYLKNLKLFLKILNKNREKLIIIENFKPIKTNDLEKKMEKKEINEIIDLVEDIIQFSEDNNKLLVIFNDKFWENLINNCNSSSQDDIMLLSNLRKLFEEQYFKLVCKLYQKGQILDNIQKFEKKDEFDLKLHSNIIQHIKKEKNISNLQIISLIINNDPVYNTDKNIDKRDIKILDLFDFEKIDKDFIDFFKSANLEIIFKKDIVPFLTKLFGKVTNWNKFCVIYDLINDTNLDKKYISNYIDLLTNTYSNLIKTKKDSLPKLTGEDLDIFIRAIYEIAVFIHDSNTKKDFFPKIKLLDKELQNKIYFEIYNKYNDKDHKDIIENVKDYYIKELKAGDPDTFISFLEKLKLKQDDYNDIIDRINNTHKISDIDFYKDIKNDKIILLIKLNNKNLILENNPYYDNAVYVLKEIYNDINNKSITISQLNSLFACIKLGEWNPVIWQISNDLSTESNKEEDFIKEKFNLFKLIDEKLDLKDLNTKYNDLKEAYIGIYKILHELNCISSNLEKYYLTYYSSEIKTINEIKGMSVKVTLKFFQEEIPKKLSDINLTNLREEAQQIEKVKNLNLFNILYRYTSGSNQKEHFENTLNNLHHIDEILKSTDKKNKGIIEEVKNNSSVINEEIKKFKQSEELSLLVNFDSYETDIKAIFYLFDNLRDDENWNKILCPKYKDISKENIEQYLKELKEKNIYDYQSEAKSQKSGYIKFFNYLYQKQQAIDFLKQPHENLNLLYEKLDPSVGTLSAKDIDDTIICVRFFNELKNLESNEDAFNYIKNKFKNDEKLIESFKNFSEVYPSIDELNQSFDDYAFNLYDEVKLIMEKTEIILSQNDEEIKIKGENEKIKLKIETIDDLFTLKNKINVKPKNNAASSENEKKLIKKNNSLLFFKDIMNNIESFYEHLIVLRTKGNILPIRIKVEITDLDKDNKNDNINIRVKYYLNDYKGKEIERSFEFIEKFLSNAKNDFIQQLELYYKIKDELRFFYGKQIMTIVNHLNGNKEIFSFIKYILNDIGKGKNKIGVRYNDHSVKNFVRDYEEYHSETFKNINEYVGTLFQNNGLTLSKHYEKIKIKNGTIETKGIYIYESDSESMEEDILEIFLDKIGRLPVAQNILITNKETSYEEMQAFLNRAILCRYNTLFVIEINESFSQSQQRYLNRFVDKLISYKNTKVEKVDIKNPSKCMDSCLVFIYNKKSKSALDYIKNNIMPDTLILKKKHNINSSGIIEVDINTSKNELDNIVSDMTKTTYIANEPTNENLDITRDELNENIHIIKSEICGLGKTEFIKKEIKKKEKRYIHFPVGGNITRDILYKKLNLILDKIKNIENDDKLNAAIHLDLYDNNEASILNEFLFSFLITKFYSNSENIIYIPIDIEIYVEVPNCFDDFLSKYKILNCFKIKNIKLDEKPELELPENKMLHYKNMLNLNSNKEIEDNINQFFTISEHSYHQLSIFINLFIGQYSKTNDKRQFMYGKVDVTDKVIECFKNCTKYFTSGSYANLLTNKDLLEKLKNGKEEEYIKKLEEAYDNDLENQTFDYPLIFRNPKEEGQSYYYILSISKKFIGFVDFKNNPENYGNSYKMESSKYYLSILNAILELNSSVKRLKDIIDEDEYVITNDNFRKMVLIIYRIVANIPVILMGETGCGKTTLIRKLYQLMNDGHETFLEFINIHPGITDNMIKNEMIRINKKASNTNELIWIFFDELNTCNSFSLLTEIFINRSFEGEKLKENIRLLGACNPYRIREEGKIKCGLSHPEDMNDTKKDYVYLVNMLPQSLMYYIFNFGSINQEDEKKYIKSIISNSKYFKKDEEKLKDLTKDIISKCHQFLRKKFGSSSVSLREISRFSKCLIFFMEYYNKKNEYYKNLFNEKNKNSDELETETYEKYKNIEINVKIAKLKSIILSIYVCYYIRLTDRKHRTEFDMEMKEDILNLINNDIKEMKKDILKINSFEEMKNNIINIVKDNDIKNMDKDISSIMDNNKIKEIKTKKEELLKMMDKYDTQEIKEKIIDVIDNKSIKDIEELRKKIKNEIDNCKNDKIKNKIKELIKGTDINDIKRKIRNIIDMKDKIIQIVNNTYNDKNDLIENIENIINKYGTKEMKDKINKVIEQEPDDKLMKDKIFEIINKNNEKERKKDIFNGEIENTDFTNDIEWNGITQIQDFSQIIELEEDFIIDKVELDKGIGKSRSLKENLFLIFISLGTIIPLIIIGKPGSGKSLSSHLIYKSMKGKYSTNKFFKLYPSIIQSYFQGSKSATPEEVENIFKIAEGKLESFSKKKFESLPISMLLFDELGLAERSKYNPLKVLHKKLDDYFSEHKKSEDSNLYKVAFIGITNWNLDAAKLNRALSLSVPDLDIDQEDLIETSITIANSFNSNFADKKKISNNNGKKNEEENEVKIFEELLPKIYFNYKKSLKDLKKYTVKKNYIEENPALKKEPPSELEKRDDFLIKLKEENKIKIDFHGNRDFFNLIKGIARELNKTNEIEDIKSVVKLIIKYIERNFAGMIIPIDIDENDFKETENKDLKYLRYLIDNKMNQKSITSVSFFKCIYNKFVVDKAAKIEKYKKFEISEDDINAYKIIDNIYDNVKDENSRYLLLGIKPSLSILINQIIDKKMNMIKQVDLIEGSTFINDENMEYQYRILNEIQECAKNEKGHILFLQNLNSIYPFLYDLFNMNYLVKDGKNYARICHGNYSDQLVLVSKLFRIIIMVDKKYMDKLESPFLNRFEKMIIKFDELLNPIQKNISKDLLGNECNFKQKIKNHEDKVNYKLKDLLIGCKEEDIQGLVYDFNKDREIEAQNAENEINEIKSNVIKKLLKLLPQDIIIYLDNDDPIKKEYFKNKKFYDIDEYIKKKDSKYKISIIYTFNSITDNINVIDSYGESLMISDIKSERELKKKITTIIENYKKTIKEKKNYIFLRFIQSNSEKLNFIIPLLKKKILFRMKIIFLLYVLFISKEISIKMRNQKKFTIFLIYTVQLNNYLLII